MANDTVSLRLTNLSPLKRALLEKRLKEKGLEVLVPQTIRRRATGKNTPVSFAQERLWFLNQLDPESPAYNDSRAVRLHGSLDVDALKKTFDHIVARHEVLRTTIEAVDGTPMQFIAPSRMVELPLIDLRARADKNREAEAHRLIIDAIRRPFNLSRDLMLRVLLLRLADQEHILLSVKHHVASDGWSSGIFWREVSALYQAFISGQSCPLSELPVQYADYAAWQREWLRGEVLDRQLSYWKKQLDNVPTLQLPVDRPRPAIQTYPGARASSTLSKEVAEGLKALSRDQGVTLFMTLLAAFQTLLYRYTAQDDIAVGSPIAGRTRQELEGLIGFFVNSLVLRTDLSGHPTFKELLGRVREVTVGAYAHQDLPFEKLVEEVQPERSPSHSPLFQVVFAVRNDPRHVTKLASLRTTPFEISSGTAKSDLYFSIIDNDENLRARCEYNTDLFDASTIERMIGHFKTLLEGIVANPEQRISEIPLLTESEKHQLLVEWNDTKADYPKDKCIHQLFETQVEKTPDAIALIFEDRKLTYRELNNRANQLAHYLRKLGVGPEVPVGVCVERSMEMVVGLLGILKAGGVYAPVDPAYPKERLGFMLEDTKAGIVVTDSVSLKSLPTSNARLICLDQYCEEMSKEPQDNPNNERKPDDLAYVIYTSGSTGLPKGVEVPHRGVVRLLFGVEYVRLDADQTFLHLASISFDAATFEMWGALLHGGKCVLYPGKVPSPRELGELLKKHRVNTLWLTASLFNTVINEEPHVLSDLKQLLIGGEALSVPHVRKGLALLPNTKIINGYGPTESTTFTCCYPIPRELGDNVSSIPIGKPIGNTQVYILDAHLNSVPIGVEGDLYIGGDGLARGYLNRPELTVEKFIVKPFSNDGGGRLYKTEDRARYLADGNIEFLGRIDNQVKIRGFRIELGEIESVLGQHSAIVQAIVFDREIGGDKRLIGYVVHTNDQPLSSDELKVFLRKKLPEYMIPSTFVFLDALPMTSNGKIDRGALPPPDQSSALMERGHAKPRTLLEHSLAEIWGEVLNLEKVGAEDNFFELGGHSLLAVKLVSQSRQKLGIDLRVTDLFESPTINQLAASVEGRRKNNSELQRTVSNFSHVVHLKIGTDDKRIFCIPFMGGFRDEFYHFIKLVRLMGPEYSFLGIRARGVDGITEPDHDLKAIVAHHVKEIQTIQPRGPYFLLAECFGGKLAYEIAQQLQDQGESIGMLAFLDSNTAPRPLAEFVRRRLGGSAAYRRDGSRPWLWKYLKKRSIYHLSEMRKLGPRQRMSYFLDKARQGKQLIYRTVRHDESVPRQAAEANGSVIDRGANKHLVRAENAYYLAIARVSHRRYKGRIILVTDAEKTDREASLGWEKLATEGVETYKISGNHNTYITENTHLVAATLTDCLEKTQAMK